MLLGQVACGKRMELTCTIHTGQWAFFVFAQSGIEESAHALKLGVHPRQTPMSSLSYISVPAKENIPSIVYHRSHGLLLSTCERNRLLRRYRHPGHARIRTVSTDRTVKSLYSKVRATSSMSAPSNSSTIISTMFLAICPITPCFRCGWSSQLDGLPKGRRCRPLSPCDICSTAHRAG